MSLPQTKLFTADQYLAWEAQQAAKSEYIDGEIFAMAGASDAHVTVTLNLATALKPHLRGSGCRVYAADMKVRVVAANAFFYPDVLVSCDARDRSQEHYKSNPILLAEVLSPSTAAYDRGAKFAYYRLIDSLREYVLIDPANRTVDLFRRGEDNHWVLYPYAADETVELDSVALKIALADLFEDVSLPEGISVVSGVVR